MGERYQTLTKPLLTGHVSENKAISLCFKRRPNPRLAVVITDSRLNI